MQSKSLLGKPSRVVKMLLQAEIKLIWPHGSVNFQALGSYRQNYLSGNNRGEIRLSRNCLCIQSIPMTVKCNGSQKIL